MLKMAARVRGFRGPASPIAPNGISRNGADRPRPSSRSPHAAAETVAGPPVIVPHAFGAALPTPGDRAVPPGVTPMPNSPQALVTDAVGEVSALSRAPGECSCTSSNEVPENPGCRTATGEKMRSHGAGRDRAVRVRACAAEHRADAAHSGRLVPEVSRTPIPVCTCCVGGAALYLAAGVVSGVTVGVAF